MRFEGGPARAKEQPMQISNSAYMGVEVLVRLAAHETDRPCTAQSLGEWTKFKNDRGLPEFQFAVKEL